MFYTTLNLAAIFISDHKFESFHKAYAGCPACWLNLATIYESSRYLAGISWDPMCSKHLREGLVLCKRLSEVYPQKIALVSSTEPLSINLVNQPTYISLTSSGRTIRIERCHPCMTDQQHCPKPHPVFPALLLTKGFYSKTSVIMKLLITKPNICVCFVHD